MKPPIERYLEADTAERLRMALDPSLESALSAHLGAEGLRDIRQLATVTGTSGHLAIDHPTNLIFVPGIMGSLLHSRTQGGVWWIDARTRHHLDHLGLAADGGADADARTAIEAFNVDTSYEPFLCAALREDDVGHVTHPFDWRKPLDRSVDGLVRRVEEAWAGNGGQGVHLVAHSMGGLLVRLALLRHPDLWNRVGRIVFIGTPHHGAPAIAGYLKHHFWGNDLMGVLALYLSRKTFRSMWGALSLLPAPLGVYPGTGDGDPDPWPAGGAASWHPCGNFDFHAVDDWKLELDATERASLQNALDGAAALHRELDAGHRALMHRQRDRMLMIAGIGYKTLFRLDHVERLGGLWESTDKVVDRIEGDPHRDGDGRVPVASARLPGVETRFVRGVHGALPNIPAVYADVFRWLRGETPDLPDSPDGALRRHLAGGTGSEAPSLDGSDLASPFGDDPGYLGLSIDAAAVHALDARVAQSAVPAFEHLKIL